MTFAECLQAAAACSGLVAEFDRLQGTNLSFRGSPVELGIDRACRRQEAEAVEFVRFVFRYVWVPLGGCPFVDVQPVVPK